MTLPSRSHAQLRLLNRIEAGVRSIQHMLDCGTCGHRQVALALEGIGLYCTLEVALPVPTGGGAKRCDIVVVDALGTVAIEVDGWAPRESTREKLRLLPPEVLRVLILRHRKSRPAVPLADRIICMRASLDPLLFLNRGAFGISLRSRSVPRTTRIPHTLLELKKG